MDITGTIKDNIVTFVIPQSDQLWIDGIINCTLLRLDDTKVSIVNLAVNGNDIPMNKWGQEINSSILLGLPRFNMSELPMNKCNLTVTAEPASLASNWVLTIYTIVKTPEYNNRVLQQLMD